MVSISVIPKAIWVIKGPNLNKTHGQSITQRAANLIKSLGGECKLVEDDVRRTVQRRYPGVKLTDCFGNELDDYILELDVGDGDFK